MPASPQEQLFEALHAQDLGAVRDALERGADVNAPNDAGERPIEHPCGAEILELLFARGADVRALERDTPLLEVVLRHSEEPERRVLMRHLVHVALDGLSRGERLDLELDEGDGYRPLHLALRVGELDAALRFLAAGARVDTPTDWGDTPLHIAVWERHPSLVDRLLSLGAGQLENNAGWTPLHLAVRQMHVPIAKALLAAGAAVDARDRAGRTPMFWLGDPNRRDTGDDRAMLELLLANGADLQVRTSDGWTALHAAVLYGYPAAVQLFLEAGIACDVVTAKGETPLALALELDRNARERATLDDESDYEQRRRVLAAEIIRALRAYGARD